jgi:hypothetical protein
MTIDELFDEVASQMRSDLSKARSALDHPGLKGSAFEDRFREFLRRYLPDSLDISTGVAVDAEGNMSRQLDVIISDAMHTPIFFRSGNTRVVPIECVYSVIEVKANLDSEELDRCFTNMESVRSLSKKAYVENEGVIQEKIEVYGQKWDIWPTNYFIFAFDSVNLRPLAEKLSKLNDGRDLHSRIDSICSLEKGVITNRGTDGQFDALPTPGSQYFICETEKALLLFYALASRYFFQAKMPRFNFVEYLGTMEFGG